MPDPDILVAGRDPLARSGIAALLRDRLRVVGSVDVRADLGNTAARAGAQAVVIDVGSDGVELLVDLDVPAVALVADADEAAAALAHVGGVLLRDGDPDRLEAALRGVVAGLVVIDDAFEQDLLRVAPATGAHEPLTPREREVLDLLADGLSNRAIGEALGVSRHTAKFHVDALLAKLGASSRTEVVVRAARAGLLRL